MLRYLIWENIFPPTIADKLTALPFEIEFVACVAAELISWEFFKVSWSAGESAKLDWLGMELEEMIYLCIFDSHQYKSQLDKPYRDYSQFHIQ